jgi:hypothetical protein
MAMQVRTTAKSAMVRALIWVAASLLFADVAWGKVRDLRAAGMAVSPWRYVQVGFWVVVLGFWVWQAWANWQRRLDA